MCGFSYIYLFIYGCSFRRLANRAAAARFKEKQTMHILDLERRVKILEKTNASLVGTMTLMEVWHITLATIYLSCLRCSYKDFFIVVACRRKTWWWWARTRKGSFEFNCWSKRHIFLMVHFYNKCLNFYISKERGKHISIHTRWIHTRWPKNIYIFSFLLFL